MSYTIWNYKGSVFIQSPQLVLVPLSVTLVEGDLAITKVDAVLDHTQEEVAFILVPAIKQPVVLEENRKWKKNPRRVSSGQAQTSN